MENAKEIIENINNENLNAWLNGYDLESFNNKNNKKDEKSLSINECIEKCTSPDKEKIFNALTLFKPEETRILILGQDPYPEQEKAHGFSFSVKNEYTQKNGIDDSLFNIFTAIEAYKNNIHFCDLSDKQIKEIKGTKKNKIWTDFWKTDLTNWAKNNGVLLLNTALTYEKTAQHNDIDKKSLTKQQKNEIKNAQKELLTQHQNAWKPFVQQIICNLLNSKIKNQDKKLAVFLWGVDAQNIFSQSLQILEEREQETLQKISDIPNNLFTNKQINKLLHYPKDKTKNYDKGKKIKLFMTSHPSNYHNAVKNGFCHETPKHFDDCDNFLFDNKTKEYIWKNFPDNNKKQ